MRRGRARLFTACYASQPETARRQSKVQRTRARREVKACHMRAYTNANGVMKVATSFLMGRRSRARASFSVLTIALRKRSYPYQPLSMRTEPVSAAEKHLSPLPRRRGRCRNSILPLRPGADTESGGWLGSQLVSVPVACNSSHDMTQLHVSLNELSSRRRSRSLMLILTEIEVYRDRSSPNVQCRHAIHSSGPTADISKLPRSKT
eukprot:6204718-Pleurochrysis_carterae.AAC.1